MITRETNRPTMEQNAVAPVGRSVIHVYEGVHPGLWIIGRPTYNPVNDARSPGSGGELAWLQNVETERIVWLVTGAI